MNNITKICAGLILLAQVSGCASTYSNLVSGSSLGAQEYRPSVLVKDGNHSRYEEILKICRDVAVNKQITASQEAQLKTITGVTAGSLEGAAFGMQFGSIFKDAGWDSSINRSIGVGLAAGALSGLAQSFAGGTENAAEQTKSVLLTCLRAADPGQQLYAVLE